jgi:hypothetical protein
MNIIYIAAAVVFLLALFCAYVASQSSEFKVERSATIDAPPLVVFPHVNDLHQWQEWSPWAKMDPNARTTYDGPVAGVGAAFGWAGGKKIGQGRMTITDSRPGESLQIRLEFEKPMKATNIARFTFQPVGDKTTVTWSMTGTYNFMGKLFNVIINCDGMCAKQFDQGLAAMKSIVEKRQEVASAR